jgi:hypothetical protein
MLIEDCGTLRASRLNATAAGEIVSYQSGGFGAERELRFLD